MKNKKIRVKIALKIQDGSLFTYTGITDFMCDRLYTVNNIKKVNIYIFENDIRKASYLIMGDNITKEYITNIAIEFLEVYLRCDDEGVLKWKVQCIKEIQMNE